MTDPAIGAPSPAGELLEMRPVERPVAPPQPHLWTILVPKWRSVLARFRRDRSLLRFGLLGGVGLIFWSAVFGVSLRVIRYFISAQEIGSVLAGKVLGMMLLAFASILLLSNLVTALSTYFLAKDLDILVASPVDWFRIYLAKLGETLVHSSWMVALLAFPILAAYGVAYDGGWLFPFVSFAALLPYLVLPTVIGAAITLVLVNVFPAQRTRDLLSLVALATMAGLVLFLRVARPEQLARPEGFNNLVDFLTVLKAPTNPLLPSEWASQSIMNWLLRIADPLPLTLLWTTALAFVVMGAALHRRLYAQGFSKAQEGAEKFVRGRTMSRWLGRLIGWLPVTRREFILKDLKVFFRDSTQWSQLILLAVLLIVYVFNIRALPLFTGERVPFMLVTLVVFLNQGLAGFVLSAIAARFIFPSVSLEGRQLWLLRSGPLDFKAMLWSKYWVGTLPLLFLALLITIVTNTVLRAAPVMIAISLVTTIAFTLAVGGMALGFGVLYPQFDTENAAQIPTSFGGLVFMMTAVSVLAGIIVIEAAPIAGFLRLRQAGLTGGVAREVGLALTAVVLLCGLAMSVPLRLAVKRLEEMELG